MKNRFRYDDLTYGVVLAALIFAFDTVLDEVRSDDFASVQAVASATVQPAQAAAVASSTAATVSAR